MAGLDAIEGIAAATGWVGLARGPNGSERFPYSLVAWGLTAQGKYGRDMIGLTWLPGDGFISVEDLQDFQGYEYHGPTAHAVE